MHRSTLKYALTAVLATGAIAASPAMAMPIDGPVNRGESPTGSLAGTTEKNLKQQDLRNELSKDTAFQADRARKLQPGQPVFPTYVPPLKPKVVPASTGTSNDSDGDDVGIWLLLLSGLAGAGLAGGGAAGISRRSRVRARRVAA